MLLWNVLGATFGAQTLGHYVWGATSGRQLLVGKLWGTSMVATSKQHRDNFDFRMTFILFSQAEPEIVVADVHIHKQETSFAENINSSSSGCISYHRSYPQIKSVSYGNNSYGVSNPGIQNQKDFCLKIYIPKENY